MKKILFFVVTFVVTFNLSAIDINSIKRFSEFNNIVDYESYLETIIEKCLDSRSNDIEGNKCLIRMKVWDRELDYFYNELYSSLDSSSKVNLKSSKSAWVKEKDNTFVKLVGEITSKYPNQGTMFKLMKNDELDIVKSKIIKNRTLELIKMLNKINSDK